MGMDGAHGGMLTGEWGELTADKGGFADVRGYHKGGYRWWQCQHSE